MKEMSTLKNLLILLAALAVVTVGCNEKRRAVELAAQGGGANGDTGDAEIAGLAIDPGLQGESYVAITRYDQLLPSLGALTGTTASAETQRVYGLGESSLSKTGSVEDVTSGLWMAITAVSGSVCTDLYDKERALADAQRIYYRGIALMGSDTSVAAESRFMAQKENVIKRLALGVWGRYPSSSELSDFDTALTESGLFGRDLTEAERKNALLISCSGVLGSLAAHVK